MYKFLYFLISTLVGVGGVAFLVYIAPMIPLVNVVLLSFSYGVAFVFYICPPLARYFVKKQLERDQK